eukprot:TRINITY_DN65965_c0_g2_i1.p1 TRINITY_DN65965_c0_g2~~TRINITY_DN65965_c0_g2_i1.p1  ORF type:complete len:1702 (-),score=356.35 TRINITY_DN65965_c0_g2_i1:154-5214(-)
MERPVEVRDVYRLSDVEGGISPQSINFKTVTMESDKYLCVRDQSGDQNSIVIVEIANKSASRHKMAAESAIMNPVSKVLALKAGTTLQIFNLDMRTKMKSYNMPDAVVYWRWISNQVIALVTATSVYHWSMEGSSDPVKVFDRLPELAETQILNYRTDSSLSWLILIGVAKQPDGTLKGVMQLTLLEKNTSKILDGHAACFMDATMPSGEKACLMCVASNSAQGGRLLIMEVPVGAKQETTFERKIQGVSFSSPNDFPVAVQASAKHGLIYLVTRTGYLYLFDVFTATLIYSDMVTQEPIFVTSPEEKTNGLLGVSTSGKLMSIHVNENTIVRYIHQNLGNYELAVGIAARADLGGADELFTEKFTALLQQMNIQEAVQLVAKAPRGLLRTRETINKLQAIPQLPGQQPALSVYFKYLLEKGSLNAFEAVELARIVLQKPGGAPYIKKLMEESKLEESEDLGDILQQHDSDLALKIYFKAAAHLKVINVLLQRGEFAKVVQYCGRVNYSPDWSVLLANLINVNPDAAVQFATHLHDQMPDGPPLNPNSVIDMFVSRHLIKQVTAYLLEILKGNKEEDAALQTRLLETNLQFSPPQVADQILAQCGFSHYDALKIANLCEKAQLYQRALENYANAGKQNPDAQIIPHIRRVIINTHAIAPEWLVDFFGGLSAQDSLDCLKELLNHNARQNFKVCVQVATKYSDELGASELIELFLGFKAYEALYYYLGSIVNYSNDPEVHFRYIEAATMVGQYSEVERVTRESTVYEPERTKNFLKEKKLADLWPLVNVCDQHDYLDELVKYLYDTQNLKYVDMYVQKKNPLKTPYVVGALLDCDANEDYIKTLIMSVGNMCPIEPLVDEVEKRNRIRLIQNWLEARQSEGNQEAALHNALGKIYIDSNQNVERFLQQNQFYDPKVLGKYCENRDPNMAYVAYEKGQCDYELVELTSKNCMFKQQSRYLVKRQDAELWAHVLKEDDDTRRQLVDQVVQTALPETNDPEELSTTVKAFMEANLPHELTELLEKIVLHGNSEFKQNRYLQNLLLLTAITQYERSSKAEDANEGALLSQRGRVMEYIQRLNGYDSTDIATLAVGAELYEEAFTVYKKFDCNVQAIKVLLEMLNAVDRATEFAERVNENDVWSVLGNAQLKLSMITEAVGCFLKAADASNFQEVIDAAENTECYADLVKYLNMARNDGGKKEAAVDTELVYAYAKTDRLADLEEFITGPNVAQIQYTADRCFNENLFEAAKILYTNVGNFARLAITLVRLQQFYAAVDAAQKANSIKTWKEVMEACVDAEEFRLAQMAALQIVVQPDELEDVVKFYETKGYFDELMSLMKAGLGLDRAHMGMFTELGVLYAKYKPSKLMEHIKLFHRRINVHKLIRFCEKLHHWAEARFLYTHNDEYDSAAKLMMEHPIEAWDHEVYKETIVKCSSLELCYQSIHFYIETQPTHLTDLLGTIQNRVDHERVVHEVKKENQLPLAKQYLENVQEANLRQVNEAVNSLYIEEEDYESLRLSIDQFDNFDQIGLAEQLRKHELLEFRRVSSALYKRNKRWQQSVELSKADKIYKDALQTVAESEDHDLAEELMRFFVDNEQYECFSACLYVCYDLIRPDVALELGWRHNKFDMIMPYMIQVFKEYGEKINSLEKKVEERAQQQGAQQQAGVDPTMMGGGYGGYGGMGAPLQLQY